MRMTIETLVATGAVPRRGDASQSARMRWDCSVGTFAVAVRVARGLGSAAALVVPRARNVDGHVGKLLLRVGVRDELADGKVGRAAESWHAALDAIFGARRLAFDARR